MFTNDELWILRAAMELMMDKGKKVPEFWPESLKQKNKELHEKILRLIEEDLQRIAK